MRLTAITIKNFKGIGEQGCRIEFAPITLLFGPNNAGKSTIIQALHLAQEILCRPDADLDRIDARGAGVNLGTFKDYVHEHNTDNDIVISLEMGIDGLEWIEDDETRDRFKRLTDELYNVKSIKVEFTISMQNNPRKPLVKRYMIWINDIELTSLELYYDTDGSTIADVDKFNLSYFLPEKSEKQLREDAEALWNKIGQDEDYGNELLNLAEEVIDRLAPHFQPYASARKLLATVLGSDELAEMGTSLEEQAFSCVMHGRYPYQWCTRSIKIIHEEGEKIELSKDFKPTKYPTSASIRIMFRTLLFAPLECAEQILNRMIYIGPLRTIPDRDFSNSQKPNSERWASGLAAWDVLTTMKDEQLDIVNNVLNGASTLNTGYQISKKQILGLDLDADRILVDKLKEIFFKVNFDDGALPLLRNFLGRTPQQQLMLTNVTKGIQVQPHDMGAGISQLIPCIVAAVIAKPGQLVSIEQPELHIHPAWQTALADVFIRAIAGKDNPPIFLIETHSEHFMLRLLRRIRETAEEALPEGMPPFTPDDLSVIYFQQDANSKTEIMQLPVDRDGNFTKKWPNGFFEERIQEFM